MGLRERGWIEGKNVSIEYLYGEGDSDRVSGLAADLVRHEVDVIVASVTPDAFAAKRATSTIPIVLVAAGDPVELGLVASLSRPGGNITGLSPMTTPLGGKRLGLLAEMVPKLTRVAVLRNPRNKSAAAAWNAVETAAKYLGIQLHSFEVGSPKEFDRIFEQANRIQAGAIFLIPDPVITPHVKRLAELALKNRMPSIFHVAEFVEVGGLMSYGPDRTEMFRHAASFVDRILRGTRPADLPIEQPTTFELVVNLKTAKALGITMPPEIMVQATRVIQ